MSSHRVIIQAVNGMAEAYCECGWSVCVEYPEHLTVEQINRLVINHRLEVVDGTPLPTMTDEEVLDAVDGLFAYDSGCVDSGIHDSMLKERLREYLSNLRRQDEQAFKVKLLQIGARLYSTKEAQEQGYTQEDVDEVVNWVNDLVK